MARQASGTVIVERTAQIRALVAPLRQDIIDTLQSLGATSVAELAQQLGRRADGLYYHLRALEKAGLLRRAGERRDGQGRPQALYETAAPEAGLRLRYPRESRAGLDAVRRIVTSMLRTAERDFASSLAAPEVETEGAGRELWAGRNKGWLSKRELARVNALLAELGELLRKPRSAQRDRLFSVTYVLAPQRGRAKTASKDDE